MATVTEVLASAMKSVELINGVNDNSYDVEGMNQSEINDMIQRNVDHLGIVLAYEPTDEDDDTPNVVASSEDKTPYMDAIATGNTYIENNS